MANMPHAECAERPDRADAGGGEKRDHPRFGIGQYPRPTRIAFVTPISADAPRNACPPWSRCSVHDSRFFGQRFPGLDTISGSPFRLAVHVLHDLHRLKFSIAPGHHSAPGI